MKCCADIRGPQRMNPIDSGESLTNAIMRFTFVVFGEISQQLFDRLYRTPEWSHRTNYEKKNNVTTQGLRRIAVIFGSHNLSSSAIIRSKYSLIECFTTRNFQH